MTFEGFNFYDFLPNKMDKHLSRDLTYLYSLWCFNKRQKKNEEVYQILVKVYVKKNSAVVLFLVSR